MSDIKHLRYQSILYERLSEALSSLNDSELNGLMLIDVRLAKGKNDATLYIDASGFDQVAKNRLLSKLQKASGFLSQYLTITEGWYKAPKLHFKMDETINQANRLDEIFAQIKGEK